MGGIKVSIGGGARGRLSSTWPKLGQGEGQQDTQTGP